MKKTLNLLAFDLGASNGRSILGRFDGERVTMEELSRFENRYVSMNGVLYWDCPFILEQLKEGLAAFQKRGLGSLDAFGIDSWGVDYGLIDKNGHLLSNPRSYRYASDADMPPVWEHVSAENLFYNTGIANQSYNTVYQLYRRKREGDAAMEQARALLLTPDLYGYFLTGEMGSEYTIATTTQLYNPATRDWDWATIRALGLNEQLFTQIQPSCTCRGNLRQDIAEALHINRAAYVAVGGHDTASAVAAIPGSGSFAFCSSGTWSLFGVETSEPVLTNEVREAGFSNEGTIQGGFRPLRNIMGLWIIQECRRDWNRAGMGLSWGDIVAAAEQAKPFQSIIDPDYPPFFEAGDMVGKIRRYCQLTGQTAPETVGEVARAVYESLALKYRWAMERLEEIKGERIGALNIVGGGIQNKLLNQMAASAIDRPVVTGPIEGAAIGNILACAMALGEIGSMDELRAVVRRSEATEEYTPKHNAAWEDAYERLLAVSQKANDAL